LSDEQFIRLRSIVKDSGTGVQGHSRSATENARALLHVRSYQQRGMSYDAAVKTAAAAELVSPSTLRAVSQQFAATGALTATRTPVDRSNPLHPFYIGERGPSLEAQLLVHRLLREVALENTFQSCVTLRTELAAHLGIVVSKSTVHRWLHSLGYVYGRKHFVNSDPSYRWALIRRYIYQYAAALKEQEEGTAIIVYMDESYIHSHHCSKFLWHSLSSATKNEVRGDCKGKRIIIMHAMTKDGLLAVEGTEPSNILTELYHSCALIFDEVCVDNVTPADYHDTINGEKFIGWMRQRLFPTVQRLYPGKKMYLVLDNAKYHHHHGPDWFTPTKKHKGTLADWLRQRSVSSITVDDGRSIPASKFSADARGKAGGPTLVQLKTAVKQHLAAHPEINTTVPQQLMSDAGYELLYTPPYVSDLQPIEMIWAFTKALVARQSTRTRSAQACAAQTREAMEQVTAELCQKQIRHCHTWIEQFMQSQEGGSLQQFGTLAALLPLAAALIQTEAIDPLPDPPEEEDENEAEEKGWTQ
jgi:hypothetical protein